MIGIILNIIGFLGLYNVESNGPYSEETKDTCVINKIDIKANSMLYHILEDASDDKTDDLDSQNFYYDITTINYKDGQMISVNIIPKDRFRIKNSSIGVAYFKGREVLINGNPDDYYGMIHEVHNEHIKMAQTKSGPVPDGFINIIYHLKDVQCYRFFYGIGLFGLPINEYYDKGENLKVVTLPKRSIITDEVN